MTNPPLPRCFALLGGPFTTHTLQNAIQQSGTHQFVATFESELPGIPTCESWQELRAARGWEAAVFATERQEVLDAVRELALAGSTIIFEPQVLLPPEFVAELALLEAEGTAQIVPFFGWRAFPAIRLMQHIVEAGELGPLLEITIDRDFNGPPGEAPRALGEAAEGTSLLMDIDIIRMLGGDYSRVTLLQTGVTEEGPLRQTLQLTGPDMPSATCSYHCSEEFDWLCRVVGADATATMKFGHGCQIDVDGKARTPADPEQTDIDFLSLQILDESLRGNAGSPRWQDLVRFYEIQAAMQRSLVRRRTIDLQFETTSERSQFKTHMATIGCGVILWTMFGIIGLLFAGAVLDPRDGMQRQAEAAGFVIRGEAFEPDRAALTPDGGEQVEHIGAGMGFNDAVVYIEATSQESEPGALDEQRREEVWSRLSAAGAEDPSRVVVRPLRGEWFSRVMNLARVLVFAPVAVYLLVQLLLLITRPAAPQSQNS